MSKKHVIEVQAPEGKIPVYDKSTRTISFIDEDIKSRVKSVADAFEALGEKYPSWLESAPCSIRKMNVNIHWDYPNSRQNKVPIQILEYHHPSR